MNLHDLALYQAMNGEGSSVTVEPLEVTENGDYTAEDGKAYNPINVYIEPKFAYVTVRNRTSYSLTCTGYGIEGSDLRVFCTWSSIAKSKTKLTSVPYGKNGLLWISTSQSATITGENIDFTKIETITTTSGYEYLIRCNIPIESDDSVMRYINIA